jgi:type I restriction enzyme S subunit
VTATSIWSRFETKLIKHVSVIKSSNVDKVVDAGELPIQLCNYLDVYYNDKITSRISFEAGSAKPREIERLALRAGDVVITKDSETPDDIAVSALVDQSAAGVVCGYHLAILRARPAIIRGAFLFWCVKSRPVMEAFSIRAQGITRYGLTLGEIGSIPVPTPDLKVQKVIASFLDRETSRIDQLIEKKERMLQLLAEKKRSQTIVVVTRGLNSLAKMSPTGMECLAEAPSHWRVRRIASLYSEANEVGHEGLPVLSVSLHWGISDRELGDEDRHRIVNLIEDKTSYKRVRPGDLVYNMMRAWQGAFGVTLIDGLVSPAYVVARPKENIHSSYFEPLLRTPMWIEEFRRASKGIADFRQRLYWEHFRQVRVVQQCCNFAGVV